MMDNVPDSLLDVKFNKKIKRSANFRRREETERIVPTIDSLNDVDVEKSHAETLSLTKEKQKMRMREIGLNVDVLMKSVTSTTPSDVSNNSIGDKIYGLQAQFTQQSDKKTEDVIMAKYIEEELAKKHGKLQSGDNSKSGLDGNDLFNVSDHLKELLQSRKATKSISADEIPSAIGIMEVDLGLSAKLKTIEQTEVAKRQMLDKKLQKNINSTDPSGDRKRSHSNIISGSLSQNYAQLRKEHWEENYGPGRSGHRHDYDKKVSGTQNRVDLQTDDAVVNRYKRQFLNRKN